MNEITAHPKLIAFAIGFGIAMAIGTAIGMLDHGQIAFAAKGSNYNNQ